MGEFPPEWLEAGAKAIVAKRVEQQPYVRPWDEMDEEWRNDVRAQVVAAISVLAPMIAEEVLRVVEKRRELWKTTRLAESPCAELVDDEFCELATAIRSRFAPMTPPAI